MARERRGTPSVVEEAYRDRGVNRTHSRGAKLFDEGDVAGDLHVVEQGAVKLVARQPDGRETILHIVEEGEVVCPGAFLRGKPYCCSAVCESDSTTVRTISRAEVCAGLDDVAPSTFAILEAAAMRATAMCQRVVEVSSGSVLQRVAKLLLRLANTTAAGPGEPSRVSHRLTRQEIADLCGTSIESAIRAMRDLESRGFVSTDEQGIAVHDRSALNRICRGSKNSA
jgi:CRP-like cAMP-binding protein